METPKKLYLTEDNPLKEWYRTKQVGFDSIEYIRTDAFIEKAQSFFRQSHYLFNLDGIDLHNFIEDFKNYIKEE